MKRPGEDNASFYTYKAWTSQDAAALGATIGDAGCQALWEAYMLLVSICTWKGQFNACPGRLTVIGDAKGVLQAVFKRRAKSPAVNRVIMEIQLALGTSMHDIRGEHIWSEDNSCADQLSRIAEGATIPASCLHASFRRPTAGPWTFLRGGVWSRPLVKFGPSP